MLLIASAVAPTPKGISSALVEEIQDLSTDLQAERGITESKKSVSVEVRLSVGPTFQTECRTH